MAHGPIIQVLIGFGGFFVWGASSIVAQYFGRPRLALLLASFLVADCIALACLDRLRTGTFDSISVIEDLIYGFPGLILAIAILFRGGQLRWVDSDPARCVNCNYILTGNTTGICPECGQALSTYYSPNASVTPYEKRGSSPKSLVKLVLSPESRSRSLVLFFGFVSLSTAIACQLYVMAGDPSSQLARILGVVSGSAGVFFAWRFFTSKD